jgi:DNA-binding transcriptional LysR family regulator
MNSLLDSRQLNAFVMLSRTGSFTQAAKGLFLTPSAISHAIKELEERAGCRLLDRRRKKIELTQAGEQLLQHAERILKEMSVACASLEELGKWGKDRLRISASFAFCQHVLPSILEEFYRRRPESRLIVELADTLEAVELVRNNRIDLAITLEPKNERELEFHPLFTDELALFVGQRHPWAGAKEVPAARIAKQPYVLYRRNSYTFRLIEDYFSREEIVLNTSIELGSIEAIKELLKRGLGISILAPWVAAKELKEKSLIVLPLGPRKLKRNWGILCWRDRRMSWAEETFAGICATVAKQFAAESLGTDPSCIGLPADR